MADKLNIGDVVRLRTGGPKMTVIEVSDGYAHCTWFVDGKPQQHGFPVDTLEAV